VLPSTLPDNCANDVVSDFTDSDMALMSGSDSVNPFGHSLHGISETITGLGNQVAAMDANNPDGPKYLLCRPTRLY
jgi:hypothetical protein